MPRHARCEPVSVHTSTSTESSAVPLATVLICTFNRAILLGETLQSLAALHVSPGVDWDVLIVDNRSTDNTAAVVRSFQQSYPVPLRYLYEEQQGKSYALNTGLNASRSRFVLFTDDDVRVSPDWLEAAIAPMMADGAVDYTGGPVYPIWEAPSPSWLRKDRGDLWGAIAILDYGPSSFVFEEQGRIPIGANMAVRRKMLDVVGDFDPELGRRGTSLLGQEQAEFFCRARSAGARGTYVPDMAVHHHVPAQRLTRDYYRRWWFWKGISRARLHRAHPLSEGSVAPQRIKRVAGFPVFAMAEMLRNAVRWFGSLLSRDIPSAMEHQMMSIYYVGYAWEDRRLHAQSRRLERNSPLPASSTR